jgi:aryl-alcohol dehydrogenase-like predicted oxidoreductase
MCDTAFMERRTLGRSKLEVSAIGLGGHGDKVKEDGRRENEEVGQHLI